MADLYCGCGQLLTDFYARMRGECNACYTRSNEDTVEPAPAVASPDEADEEEIDPVTKRLMDAALPRHGKRACPKCFRPGYFKRMALCCEIHGPFGGI